MNTPKIYFMARSQTRVKAVRLEFYFQRPNLEILCTAASICECPHNTTYHQEFIAWFTKQKIEKIKDMTGIRETF